MACGGRGHGGPILPRQGTCPVPSSHPLLNPSISNLSQDNFGTMFHFSPSFKPNSLVEPQWFPRDITDTVESQLDQLERLEEARKQRLRSVTNVAAKTPIGLHDSSASSDPRMTNAAPGPNNRRNLYSQYRFYPPPSQAPASSSNPAANGAIEVAPSSTATSTRRRHYRTAARTRSSNASEPAAPTSSDDTSTTNLSHLSHSHISHDRSSMDSIRGMGTSFSVSSPLFNSPPLDPRGGGGGGRRNTNRWYAQQLLSRRQDPMREEGRTTPHESTTPRNFALFDTPGNQDTVTPEDQGVTNTPGHGNTEDVYSQRRRRRRREMDS